MYQFNAEFAGIPISIEVDHEATIRRCREYFTDKSPEFFVRVTDEDIAAEKTISDEYHNRHQLNSLNLTSAYTANELELEWLALYRKICTELASSGVVLIHGSAIMADGSAYLFCAPSGTGKSTHTRLWRELLGPRAVMINDDKPLIRVFDQRSQSSAATSIPSSGAGSNGPGKGPEARIYGTPWNGKHRLGSNISAPLKAICLLERGEQNRIEKAEQHDAAPLLLKYIFRPTDPAAMMDVLDTTAKIADLSDFWRLSCNMDPSAAKTSYNAMSEALEGE